MSDELSVTVRELCEKLLPCGNIDLRRDAFRVIESKRVKGLLQKRGGDVYAPDVLLKHEFSLNGDRVCLCGVADGIAQTEDGYIVDEIRCVNIPVEQITEDITRTHLACAICNACMFALEHDLERVTVRLTYADIANEEKERHIDCDYEKDELCDFVEALLGEYVLLSREDMKRRAEFEKSAKRLAFPYDSYREGQRELAEHVLEAVCTRRKLFAEAPTGIGKTMSVLFPAIKAAGNGYGNKIFYFTSKTTIAQAARDAFILLCERGLVASVTIITARERLCPSAPDSCEPTACGFACGHYDRINEAVADALAREHIFDRETIERFAKAHSVCPYELSLAISEKCELVICDYNYLFDPIVYLRRYFNCGGDYIFLIDEAHNLGDRARDMYSHSISSRELEALLIELSPSDKLLYPKLAGVIEYMHSADRLIETSERKSGRVGAFKSKKPFGILARRLEELTQAFDTYFKVHKNISRLMSDVYFDLRKYLKIAEYYDERYLSLIECRNGEYTFRQLCVDPAQVIRSRLALGRSTVFFSATLSPGEYYKDILGGDEDDLVLTLDSPFPRENLCICTTYRFSTRLDDRKVTTRALAALLETLVRSKEGNYITFFPSYKYMSEVHAEFVKRCPSIKTIIQKSDMNESERESYIKSFERDGTDTSTPLVAEEPKKDPLAELLGGTLMRGASFFKSESTPKTETSTADTSPCGSMLAFGVLGGVFSEGIDFAGDKLIGCAIVGVGLPGINDDSNLICEYYNSLSSDEYMRGYDYAYRIPGMVKVLQAAGRVIRSEQDRGVVLLIDDRYATREYSRMYPSHWKHMRLVGDRAALDELLRRFWSREQK